MRPPPKPQHPISHAGDRGIMSDYDRRGAELLVGALDGGENDFAGFIVQCASWLVTEKHVRRFRDGAGDCNPLLLAAGQLGWKMIEPFLKSDQRERIARIEGFVGDFGNECHILEGGKARNEVVELKDEADVFAAIPGKFSFIGADKIMFAPSCFSRSRRIETAKYIEQESICPTLTAPATQQILAR